MHLTPHDIEKLMLHNAGFLAQKRLARGTRLNYPEAVALIATQLLEFIRDGKSVAELMDLGRQFLGRSQVLPGVPELLHEVQIEGTFPDGTKLVTVHHPIAADHGNLTLALHGSFLPIPVLELFSSSHPSEPRPSGSGASSHDAPSESLPYGRGSDVLIPGETLTAPGSIELNPGRPTVQLLVTNMGDRPIQVGSHYPFIETNTSLHFDRAKAHAMRLDIPAGTAVRFEPGEPKTITLVQIAGTQEIYGGNNFTNGKATPDTVQKTLKNFNTATSQSP